MVPSEAKKREKSEIRITLSDNMTDEVGDGAVAIQIENVLKEMNESFRAVATQGKQNNKSFIQDIPYFGEPQDYDRKKNIIPLTESIRFLQIVDTQTSKNDFTDGGKI